jgi:hypothetical protein
MAIVVNAYWLARLWDPVCGGADVNDHPLENMDATDESDVRRLVREYLAPGFAEYAPTQQARLKATLRYGLNALSDGWLEYAFDSVLPPFAAPPNIRWFYTLIWEAMFGPEDWHIQEKDRYIVNHDVKTEYRSFWSERKTTAAMVVNRHWLDQLWAPVRGKPDFDRDHPLVDLATTDEAAVRRLVREYLAPQVARYPSAQQARLKATLRYGLNAFSDGLLKETIAQCLPPFALPPNVRWFYTVIWQELFGSEDWHMQDLTPYVVEHNRDTAFVSFWED